MPRVKVIKEERKKARETRKRRGEDAGDRKLKKKRIAINGEAQKEKGVPGPRKLASG